MLEYNKPLIPSGLVYFLINCNFIILSSKNQLNNQKNYNIFKIKKWRFFFMKETYKLPCNIAQSLNIIGDRWTLLIVHEILIGNCTFNEIKKALNGISSNLLSDRLKHLEEQGLLASNLYSDHPPRYKYTLTERGRGLEIVFNALIIWGKNNLDKCYKKMVHHSCQHEVTMAYYCPHCQKNVDDITVLPLDAKVTDRV